MRFFSLLSGLLLAGAAAAQSSDCALKSSDVEVIRYAWALQALLEGYYTSTPINQTFLSDATNGSTAEYYQNILGIQRQNRLGVRAIQQVGSKVPGYSNPTCTFTHPNATDAGDYVKNAILLEGSVAAAFIGAVPYTQSPEVSFILARLAAQHTADTTWLAAQQTGVLFHSNTSSLVPAYNPSYVLGNGTQVGRLGRWLGVNDQTENPNPSQEKNISAGLFGLPSITGLDEETMGVDLTMTGDLANDDTGLASGTVQKDDAESNDDDEKFDAVEKWLKSLSNPTMAHKVHYMAAQRKRAIRNKLARPEEIQQPVDQIFVPEEDEPVLRLLGELSATTTQHPAENIVQPREQAPTPMALKISARICFLQQRSAGA
ncbi:uncharacterized protein BDV17DRAFT_288774 [Aspergillus undulatus]|uniref:uncharacterized protein n=1 Tax=Aspergillus undulatus TaxID=1810928 RepID=UPI003CCD1246